MTSTTVVAATCPWCHGDVVQPHTGRRKVFCTTTCRADMRTAVADYHALRQELADTIRARNGATSDMWRQRHQRFIDSLVLAVAEAESRIPESLRPGTPTPISSRRTA